MSGTENGIERVARRDFTRAGLVFGVGAGALAAGYAAVPDAFARAIFTARRDGVQSDAVLVMIQLAGGNDGRRTVVPLQDSHLHDLRPQLAGEAVAKALPLGRAEPQPGPDQKALGPWKGGRHPGRGVPEAQLEPL
jgi:uncharacterized protein (DUF1501 family)